LTQIESSADSESGTGSHFPTTTTTMVGGSKGRKHPKDRDPAAAKDDEDDQYYDEENEYYENSSTDLEESPRKKRKRVRGKSLSKTQQQDRAVFSNTLRSLLPCAYSEAKVKKRR